MSAAAHIKHLAYRLLSGAQLPRLYHRLAQRGTLSIVMYHGICREPLPVHDWCFVRSELFRRHVAFYRRNFEVLPLAEAVRRLRAGDLRKPALAITFDDGYQNNHDEAFPILQQAGLPATIFLTTSLVGTDQTVWFCRINQALSQTRGPELQWRGHHWRLGSAHERASASAELQGLLKELPPSEIEAEVRAICAVLTGGPPEPPAHDSPYRMLDRDSIRTLARSGLISFGAHNRDHLILSTLFPRERRAQIEQSVADVAELTGAPCRLFAYPNGRSQDFNAEDVKTLKGLGVEVACTTRSHPNHPQTPPLELGRYGVDESLSLAHLSMMTHHLLAAMRDTTGRSLDSE